MNFYVFLTFVELDLGGAAWQAYQQELNFSVAFLNETVTYNYLGLVCGCIFLVPFVYKYGRRPIYIFSSVVQLGSCILLALTRNEGDMIAGNLLSGFGGAISEIIAQITIADVFFVHQHAAMNGWFLFAQSTGGTLGPVASGYIVDGQGWRWMWWWCVVLFAINLVLVIFFFEESKYSVATPYQATVRSSEEMATHPAGFGSDAEHCHCIETPKRKSHIQRLTMIKKNGRHNLERFLSTLSSVIQVCCDSIRRGHVRNSVHHICSHHIHHVCIFIRAALQLLCVICWTDEYCSLCDLDSSPGHWWLW